MNRLTNLALVLFFAVGLTACGGGYSGFLIPIESNLKPWVAPETDELLPATADEAADEAADEDYEDYEDEDAADADSASPAPASTPAATK